MSQIYLLSKTPSLDNSVVHIPIIKTKYLKATVNIEEFDALIFTSKEAIYALEASCINLENIKCICIAEKTALIAREKKMSVIAVAKGTAQSVASLIEERYYHDNLLFCKASVVASNILDNFVNVHGHIVYETLCSEQKMNYEKNSILIFTSPSSVNCFLKQNSLLNIKNIVAIGETTRSFLPKEIFVHIPLKHSVQNCIELAKKLII